MKITEKISTRSNRPNSRLMIRLYAKPPTLSLSLSLTGLYQLQLLLRPGWSPLGFTTSSDVQSRCRLQRKLVSAMLSLSINAQTPPSTLLTHMNQFADDSKGMHGRKFRQVTSLVPHGDNVETSPRGTAHCTHDSNMDIHLYLCICVLSSHSFE